MLFLFSKNKKFHFIKSKFLSRNTHEFVSWWWYRLLTLSNKISCNNFPLIFFFLRLIYEKRNVCVYVCKDCIYMLKVAQLIAAIFYVNIFMFLKWVMLGKVVLLLMMVLSVCRLDEFSKFLLEIVHWLRHAKNKLLDLLPSIVTHFL